METAARKRIFNQTYTGKAFCILDPTPEMVSLDDIAHSLSLQCRFNGHTRFMYSVAEHSVLVSNLVPQKLQIKALMHDAAEAYMGDITAPIKRLFPELEDIEKKIRNVIFDRFNIPEMTHDESEIIKHADLTMLETERQQALCPCEIDWTLKGITAVPGRLPFHSSRFAETLFLHRFEELYMDVPNTPLTKIATNM